MKGFSHVAWQEHDAVLFDLDGVLTPTAEVHMRAWAEMFTAFLATWEDPSADTSPYTDADYFAHVDGKPRYDGVRDLLAARGIHLPEGQPADPPEAETVCGLGNRKNDAFNVVLARDGVTPYPGSVALLDVLRDQGMPLAVVSSSANAPAVLAAAGLAGRFVTVVDGRVASALGLAGKPAPDTFIHAAKECGAAPAGAVVVEDAVSGVRAGAAGRFGLVIGVDRGAGAEALTTAGADIVVRDLGDLT
jgi:beta-phosphoglucomutase family hydrolase